MKNLLFILLASMSVMTVFAQDYSEEEILALNDSLKTNPDYVLHWCDEEISKGIKDPDVYLLKGMYYAFNKLDKPNYELAIKYNEKALRYMTKKSRLSKASVYYIRGLIYLEGWDYKNALSSFSKSIKYDSNFIDSYKKRIELYFKNEQYDLAEKDIIKIVALEPCYENLSLQAKCNLELGNLDKSREVIELIKSERPDIAYAYLLSSEIYKELNEMQSSIKEYLKYISLSSRFDSSYLVEIAQDDYEFTISLLSDYVVNDSKRAIWLMARACMYIYNAQYELAFSDMELMKTSFGENTYQNFLLTDCAYQYVVSQNLK